MGSITHDESERAHTLFHKLKFPIESAFTIVYILSTVKKGMISCEIARQFNIHQETAWSFKRKVQEAMSISPSRKLKDNVEADGTFVGFVEYIIMYQDHTCNLTFTNLTEEIMET